MSILGTSDLLHVCGERLYIYSVVFLNILNNYIISKFNNFPIKHFYSFPVVSGMLFRRSKVKFKYLNIKYSLSIKISHIKIQ